MRDRFTSLRVTDGVCLRAWRVAAALALSLAALACGSSPAPAPTLVPDAVSSITEMSPALGTRLLRGQTVTFTGTTSYTLASASSGTVVLVVQDQSNQGLQPPGVQPSVAVARGTGQVTLSQSITVPDAGTTSVRVTFLLAPAGATTTRAAASVTYSVQ